MGKITEAFVRDEVLNGDNSLDVNIQDLTTRAFDIPFHQTLGVTSLAVAIAENDYAFTAVNGHGIQAAEALALYDIAEGYGFSTSALTVVGDVITIDAPAVGAFGTATTIVSRSTDDMNVNGAVTRQVFEVANPFPIAEDITRIIFMMILDSPAEFNKFGDLAALTKGVVFRIVNDQKAIYFNAKSNADLALLMHDLTFYEAAKQGQDGLCGRYTFAGQEKHGVALRLHQGDRLEMIVQDDLRSLASFKCNACGHLTSGE